MSFFEVRDTTFLAASRDVVHEGPQLTLAVAEPEHGLNRSTSRESLEYGR